MNLQQLKKELSVLKKRGYIKSQRKGPTGIGYTLEKELHLKENNVSIPDIGGRVELKASRRNASSLITLFTFNKGVWKIPQRSILENFGYNDKSGRLSLYNMAKIGDINTQGLTLLVDEEKNEIILLHKPSNANLAIWSVYTIVGKFLNKTERLILVIADSRLDENKKEEFHFNEAYLLKDPNPESFLNAFRKGSIVIDIRMHLKLNDVVRNHGTGIRIAEKDIPLLYASKEYLL